MYKRLHSLIAMILLLSIIPVASHAVTPFYEGKAIHIVVGFAAGGGYDIYARLIARHLGKYLPGNPSIIVENMPGAGSMIAAKYIFSRTKPDGLTIATFTSQLILGQILGREGFDIDMRKFEWIGVPVRDHVVCGLTKASGITSLEQWMVSKTPVKIGANPPGDVTSDVPKIVKAVLNLPIQVVHGYKGTAEIRLAADAGEIAGGFWQWESMKVMWGTQINAGQVVVVLQVTPEAHPDLPNVPVATRFAKTEEGRQLIKAGVYDPASITRLYALPPGTPKDLVQILRKAFQETTKDPVLLEEAKNSQLDINPVTGEEIEGVLKGLFNLSPATVSKLKEILFPGK